MTIRTMTNGSAPGWDGLPNKFFKILAGPNEKDKGAPTSRPSRLAHLLAATYREMLEQGVMSQDMRTGVTSLLFKDKGRRDNIDNYRPITVLTTLYKITSRAMALRLGEVIHYLVGSAQAASKNKNAHLTCLDSSKTLLITAKPRVSRDSSSSVTNTKHTTGYPGILCSASSQQ